MTLRRIEIRSLQLIIAPRILTPYLSFILSLNTISLTSSFSNNFLIFNCFSPISSLSNVPFLSLFFFLLSLLSSLLLSLHYAHLLLLFPVLLSFLPLSSFSSSFHFLLLPPFSSYLSSFYHPLLILLIFYFSSSSALTSSSTSFSSHFFPPPSLFLFLFPLIFPSHSHLHIFLSSITILG